MQYSHYVSAQSLIGSFPRSRGALGFVQLAIAVIAVYALEKAYFSAAKGSASAAALGVVAALCYGVAFRRVTYRGVFAPLRTLIQAITLLIGGYCVLAGVVVPPDLGFPYSWIAAAAPFTTAAVAACAVAALWRPSFAVAPLVYSIATKIISAEALDIAPLSKTDFLTLVEVGLFGVCVIHVAQAVGARLAGRLDRRVIFRTTTLAFVMIVAVHFANYFYSGVQKLILDGALPWTWVLENPTSALADNATHARFAPLAHWPELNEWMILSFWSVEQVSNVLVLCGQIFVVFALRSRRFMILFLLFFDVTHVVIFLVSGIFFWKWIFLNSLLVYCISRAPERAVRANAAWSWAVVLLAPMGFSIAKLGWYDTRAFNHHIVWAVTDDGRRVEVPSNYFAIASITIAQNRLGAPYAEVFPTRTWGTTQRASVRNAANAGCAFADLAEDRWPFRRGEAEIATFFRRFHAYRLSTLDADGHVAYDLYPHHIWSNPWSFDEFRALDKRRIVAYDYGVERVCLARTRDGASARREAAARVLSVRVLEEARADGG